MRHTHCRWERDIGYEIEIEIETLDLAHETFDVRHTLATWDTHLRPTQQPPLFCIRWFPLFISRSSDGAAKHWSNRRWMPMASVLSSRNPPTLSSLRALLLLILGCAILKYPHIHQYAHRSMHTTPARHYLTFSRCHIVTRRAYSHGPTARCTLPHRPPHSYYTDHTTLTILHLPPQDNMWFILFTMYNPPRL